MNKVILCGMVGKFDTREDKYVHFSLGIKRSKKNEDGSYDTTWDNIRITAFGYAATYYKEWVNERDTLLVEGRITTYKKEINGKESTLLSVTADRIQKVSSAKEKEHNDVSYTSPKSKQPKQDKQKTLYDETDMDISFDANAGDDVEIPF